MSRIIRIFAEAMKHLLHIFITIVCIAIVAGCADNSRLRDDIDRAGRLADTRPDSAIALLDSLSPAIEQADKATRMRYDLMLIKSRDKAYIEHRNDSMIAPVVEYFTDHTDPNLTPLALYYAGRVYSDLGDAPRALDYYYNALNSLNDNPESNMMRYLISGQIGTIFQQQDIYVNAKYYFDIAHKCAKEMHDTTRIVRILLQSAICFRQLGKPDSALICYNKALENQLRLNDLKGLNRVRSQIASYYIQLDMFEKADSIFKPVLECYPSDIEQQVHSIASNIYIELNDTAKALPHIHWMLDSGSLLNKKSASGLLANIAMAKEDVSQTVKYINMYILYNDSLNKSYNNEELAKINAKYNFAIRERENEKLSAQNARNQFYILTLLLILIIVAVSATACIIYLKNKRLQAINEYQKIQRIIDNSDIGVKKHLSKKREEMDLMQKHTTDKNHDTSADSFIPDKNKPEIDSESKVAIYQSPILLKFQSHGFVPENRDWAELKLEIESAYPSFFEKLNYIGVYKPNDIMVSMLIKVGFTPGEIASVMSKSFSTISSIRSRLYKRYFSEGDSAFKNWDEFINSL